MERIEDILKSFSPIGLEETTRDASLLRRVDLKYVMPLDRSVTILKGLMDRYHALEIAGSRVFRYETTYFDTPEMSLYHEHHSGRSTRRKVRTRRYVETDRSFLELKRRTNKGFTLKARMPIQGDPASELGSLLRDPVFRDSGPLEVGRMSPMLHVRYRRITLVDPSQGERVTIDHDISFVFEGRESILSGIAVAELKQESHGPSHFKTLMREAVIRPLRMSKYCTGIISLHGEVKTNRFKSAFGRIMKMKTDEYATDNG